MLSLTGTPLLYLAAVLTVVAPIALVLVWRRRHARSGWLTTLGRLASVAFCQLVAVCCLFFYVNNQYFFFSNWNDLLGTNTQNAKVQSNGPATSGGSPATGSVGPAVPRHRLVSRGNGRVEVLTIHGAKSNFSGQVLAWLPPQYDQPQFAQTRFPVIMMLPGQPSSPQVILRQYQFGAIATSKINAGKVAPFVAIFPPLMTNPPRDTECTNVAGGPQAESWLAVDVPAAVTKQLRVQRPPDKWVTMGWSTGAFCSAKLLLKHPHQFSAAIGFGGYYQPITDHTTGNLFGGSRKVRLENSPVWLYQHHHGLRGGKLLLITGRQDRESWPPTQQMLAVSRGDPNVSVILFPTGGHNYHNYRSYLPAALEWLSSSGILR